MVISILLIIITTYFQYNATFLATYVESGVRRRTLAEKLRKIPSWHSSLYFIAFSFNRCEIGLAPNTTKNATGNTHTAANVIFTLKKNKQIVTIVVEHMEPNNCGKK